MPRPRLRVASRLERSEQLDPVPVRVCSVEPFVAIERMALTPVDDEAESCQPLANRIELGDGRQDKCGMRLPRRGEPMVNTHVDFGAHHATRIRAAEPDTTSSAQGGRLLRLGEPEPPSVELARLILTAWRARYLNVVQFH